MLQKNDVRSSNEENSQKQTCKSRLQLLRSDKITAKCLAFTVYLQRWRQATP